MNKGRRGAPYFFPCYATSSSAAGPGRTLAASVRV